MINIDWEVVEVKIVNEKKTLFKGNVNQYEKKELEINHLSRVRVIANGHLGVDISIKNLSTLDEQLERAIYRAVKGPKVNFEFGKNINFVPENNQLFLLTLKEDWLSLEHPNAIELDQHNVEFYIKTRSGHKLNHQNSRIFVNFGIKHNEYIPITRIDLYSSGSEPLGLLKNIEILSVNDETDLFYHPWLFSPLALSGIALEKWYNCLTNENSEIITFPRGVWIKDRGFGLPTDFEGSTKQPITFVEDGQLITKAYDMYSSEMFKTQPTRHNSIYGISIEDMLVEPAPTSQLLDELTFSQKSYIIITDAYCFPNDNQIEYFIVITLLNKIKKCSREFSKSVLVKLSSINNLFEKGILCGPVQCGRYPWSSPWLEIQNPLSLFQHL